MTSVRSTSARPIMTRGPIDEPAQPIRLPDHGGAHRESRLADLDLVPNGDAQTRQHARLDHRAAADGAVWMSSAGSSSTSPYSG